MAVVAPALDGPGTGQRAGVVKAGGDRGDLDGSCFGAVGRRDRAGGRDQHERRDYAEHEGGRRRVSWVPHQTPLPVSAAAPVAVLTPSTSEAQALDGSRPSDRPRER